MTTKKFIKNLKKDYIYSFWADWGVGMGGGEYGGHRQKMDYINELFKRLGEKQMDLYAVYNNETHKYDLIDKATGKTIESR